MQTTVYRNNVVNYNRLLSFEDNPILKQGVDKLITVIMII